MEKVASERSRGDSDRGRRVTVRGRWQVLRPGVLAGTLNRMLIFSESFNFRVQEWGEPDCLTWPPRRGDAACGPGF